MHGKHGISIWAFIGAMLTIYGVLITGAGIYGIWHPPQVELARSHSGIWWGAVLLVLGLVYLIKFWPEKAPAEEPVTQDAHR